MYRKTRYVLEHAGIDLNKKLNIHRIGISLFHNMIHRDMIRRDRILFYRAKAS
jgi:hypothetical protein